MLDIRQPIAAMFILIGLVLAFYGAFTPNAMYKPSLGHNINLIWGLAMFVFGLVMWVWLVLRPHHADHADHAE